MHERSGLGLKSKIFVTETSYGIMFQSLVITQRLAGGGVTSLRPVQNMTTMYSIVNQFVLCFSVVKMIFNSKTFPISFLSFK